MFHFICGQTRRWQLKLRDPLTTRAIPERFLARFPHEEALYQVSFIFTYLHTGPIYLPCRRPWPRLRRGGTCEGCAAWRPGCTAVCGLLGDIDWTRLLRRHRSPSLTSSLPTICTACAIKPSFSHKITSCYQHFMGQWITLPGFSHLFKALKLKPSCTSVFSCP